MIFIPSFNKLKKNHLIKPQKSISNKKLKLSKNNNYTYGIKSLNDGYLVNTQIESIRKSIVRVLREKKLKGFYSSFIFRVYPHVSITKKPKGVRMGGGKGSHDSWNAVVSKGKVLLEFEGLNFEWSLYLYNEINNRLPIKTKLIFLK